MMTLSEAVAAAERGKATITLNDAQIGALVRYWRTYQEYERLLSHPATPNPTVGRVLQELVKCAGRATGEDIRRERKRRAAA